MYSGIGLLVFLVVYEALSSGAQVCPKDFQCGNFGNLSFPFTDSAHPNCGLCMANCSSDQTSLTISLSHQTDERWYELLKSPLQGNSIRVLDTNLQDYLNQQMCSSFIDAIRQVNSTAISFTVEPNITMIRCTTDTNTIDKSGMETLKSLDNFTLCRDFTIYYRNPKDGDKPLNNIGPLPQQCQCITLPMAPEDSITKKSGLFGLLTAEFDLSWHLSDNCVHCLNGKGSQCDGDNSPCANAGKHVSKGMSEIAKKIIIVVRAISELFVVLPTLSLCVLITRLLCVLISRRRRQKASTEEDEELKKLNEIRDTQTRQYDFSLIKTATRDFSTTNKLGRGGFGEVYKGVLFDGKEIAVKRLSTTSGQGENEFMNEVKSLAKLQHKCLVKLLGFCLEKTERLVIYEFMANGSLDKVLFDPVNRSRLDWERRYKIMKSIARGILYLHEDSHMMIIHRDLKASNILLDEEMNAKISDFGMARLFVLDEGEVLTKRIAGTFGYMAPEYAMYGLLSVKSDVYSYGVLLLEIICGKKTYSFLTEDRMEDLPAYAYKTWKEDKASDLIDPMLTVDSDSMQNMMRCIHIALLCVQENAGDRPTMATVIHMLQSSTLTLPTPSGPGFFIRNTETVAPIAISHYDMLLNDGETDSYQYPR